MYLYIIMYSPNLKHCVVQLFGIIVIIRFATNEDFNVEAAFALINSFQNKINYGSQIVHKCCQY